MKTEKYLGKEIFFEKKYDYVNQNCYASWVKAYIKIKQYDIIVGKGRTKKDAFEQAKKGVKNYL